MEVTVVVAGDQALKVGMILEDVVGVDGLTAAGGETHLVQEHAGAHRGERVAGEVQVGHGIDDQVVGGGDQVLQGVSGSAAHLFQGDAFHGLLDQGLALEVVDQVVIQLILPTLGLDVAFEQPLIQEGLDQFGVQVQHVGHQVFQIDHFGAVVPQDLGESVVLLLSNFQEGNVIKKKLGKTIGGQMQQLLAGAMKKNFLQRIDLTANTNTFHSFSYF